MSNSNSGKTGRAATARFSVAGEKFERLKALLREMFQLDRGDLDFGLYRIMNMKAGEVEAFLEQDLLPQVRVVLGEVADEERTARKAALAKAREAARSIDVDPDTAPGVIRLMDAAKADAVAEADVYGDLVNFFSRYFREGDFMPLRRYTSGARSAYLIPYDGEEVKLHWANADQYYIKTTENYTSYAFTVGDGETVRRMRFEIAAADNENDNIKEAEGKQRRFLLMEGSGAIAREGGDLVIRLEHRPLTQAEKKTWSGNGSRQQERIDHAISAQILEALEPDWHRALAAPAPTETDPRRTLLAKHIGRFTAKNSFDYFIHKDLGGFLRRELDLFLKSDVLNLDDLAAGEEDRLRRALARMRAVRHVGEKIISFLAQLEDFQKRLWLKKKFVLETHWCVTLDRVPDVLYPEIAANDAQRREWVDLFAIDEISGDAGNGGVEYSEPLSVDFLKANACLVLDTHHFGGDFKDILLAALSDVGSLDEQTDGLLIHGENFQALKLLELRYFKRIRCVHIDPPYNTQSRGFLYKNGYQHSSWLAMMHDRIRAAIPLLDMNGSFLCHIDENEYERLHALFAESAIAEGGTIVWDKKNPMLGGKGVATQHEYVLWRAREDFPLLLRSGNAVSIFRKAKALIDGHGGVGERVRREFSRWIAGQKDFSGGERAYKYIDDDGRVYQSVGMSAPDKRVDPKFHIPLIHPGAGKPCPVPPNGWSRSPETLQRLIERDEVIFGKDENVQPRRKVFLDTSNGRQMPSVIANSARGKGDVDGLGLEFPYCHPVSLYETLTAAALCENSGITLDYFAGSGTTGHAVVNLNREDYGRRKYILVENGQHFHTVMLPRLKKVVYAHEWKKGRPVSRSKGISHLMKYVSLESYEDTLDGLVVEPPDSGLFGDLDPSLVEDYRIRYALDAETAGSPVLLGHGL